MVLSARLWQRVVFAVVDFHLAVTLDFRPAPAVRRILQGAAELVVKIMPGFVSLVMTDERRAEQVEVADGIEQFCGGRIRRQSAGPVR